MFILRRLNRSFIASTSGRTLAKINTWNRTTGLDLFAQDRNHPSKSLSLFTAFDVPLSGENKNFMNNISVKCCISGIFLMGLMDGWVVTTVLFLHCILQTNKCPQRQKKASLLI